MADIRFQLLRPYEKGTKKLKKVPVPLFAVWGSRDNLVRYGLGFSIEPKYWKKDKQRVGDYVGATNKTLLNNLLDNLSIEFTKLSNEFKANEQALTKQVVKTFLDTYFKKTDEPQGENFFKFVRHFIDTADRRTGRTGKTISLKTIQKYEQVFSRLKEYAKEYGEPSFKKVDFAFYRQLVDFLTVKCDFMPSTLDKYIRTLKTFLNEATKLGYMKKAQFADFKGIQWESRLNIYFNEQELKQLYEYDFSDKPSYDNARDLFIIGAWTGQRWSDYSKFEAVQIKENIIVKEQEKGNKTVAIPMHPTVRRILAKRGGKMPYFIEEQTMNKLIKQICKTVGFDEQIQRGHTKGGVRTKEIKYKWELAQTHTARRSFATNLYKSRRIDAHTIMNITGHSKMSTFLSYVKTTANEDAERLAKIWEKEYNTNNKDQDNESN